ncbi:replication initiator [Pseudonocardia sp. CA-142604]|uniref:replication initiator n=1 Tax=Pseudonocardia sp. CA-142604 TaxID=3240024 RepID=UPI003D92F26D
MGPPTRPAHHHPAHAAHLDDGEISDASSAGYIAKYATKGTGASGTADRRIRDIDHLDVSPHHKAMSRTCWELGALDQRLLHIGHRTYAERELAVAIAERNRQQRKSRTTQGRAT